MSENQDGAAPRGVAEAVAAAIREHYPMFEESGHINGTVPGGGAWDCWCGEVNNTTREDVIAHVTAAVVAFLGLTEEVATIPEWYETGEMIPNRMVQGPDMVPESRIRFTESGRVVSPWVSMRGTTQ